MPTPNEAELQIESIETMVRALENAQDPALRTSAQELVKALMQLHGSCIERMLEIVSQAGAVAQPIIDSFARDEKVRSLLLLYDLHPQTLESRILEALEKTRPYLRLHGGNVELVELVGIDDLGGVTLRLVGSCDGCPSSSATLKQAVETAIYEAAPDVTAIRVEGLTEEKQSTTLGFVPLASLQTGNHSSPKSADVEWENVNGLDTLLPGGLRTVEVAGQSVLFCKLDDVYYAYNNVCPGCGQPLGVTRLAGGFLACGICGQEYDIVHAGRGVGLEHLHLESIPMLVADDLAKIGLDTTRAQRSVR
jgi:Fe-S cluster biogenesis protein NfuA/nitrite reductase/ring-hydroxylating ferredoxin subunit